MADDRHPGIALVAGAGFSKALGGLTTAELEGRFLKTPPDSPRRGVEAAITEQLQHYWERVFGYRSGGPRPSLPDHFTELDLAANSGHQIGKGFPPDRLRAIRRLSIYRIFTILAARAQADSSLAARALGCLRTAGRLGIISLNWDTLAEEALRAPCYYKPRSVFWRGQPNAGSAVPVMKLHGSVNWAYCDTCRVISRRLPEEPETLYRSLFLRWQDLQRLKGPDAVVRAVKSESDSLKRDGRIRCPACHTRLSARVGTFTYRKDYALGPFQSIWYSALRWLISSRHWLFVGYSMPAADFEFRHVLKTAQMARKQPRITAVLGPGGEGKRAEQRYRQFFGDALAETSLDGFDNWARESLAARVGRLGNPRRG